MELRDLNRMFDALAPTAEQKQAGLDRLLQTERKGRPMRKLKKLTVIGIAAALMVISCAAAVVTGLDQRLLDYFGANPEQAELLTPGAVPVDVTVEDNGATFHISQVLRDRYSILMVVDFTAPEGTKLDIGAGDDRFVSFSPVVPELLDEDGVPASQEHSISWDMEVLGQPADNHLSLLYTVEMMDGIGEDAQTIVLSNIDLRRFDAEKEDMVMVYAGDWSCEVPLPQSDTGWIQSSGTELKLPDAVVNEKGIYLSPMSLEFTMGLEKSLSFAEKNRIQRLYGIPDNIKLTDRDGYEITLVDASGSGTQDEIRNLFQLPEIIDPARFQGGTLTLVLGGETFTVPLDGLVPAE